MVNAQGVNVAFTPRPLYLRIHSPLTLLRDLQDINMVPRHGPLYLLQYSSFLMVVDLQDINVIPTPRYVYLLEHTPLHQVFPIWQYLHIVSSTHLVNIHGGKRIMPCGNN